MAQAHSDMPPIKVPPNLPELVRTAFHKARANGDLSFYPTQVALLDVNSVPFQLRFSPSLANKPKASTPPSAPAKTPPAQSEPSTASAPARTRPKFDPFESPQPGLFVADLPPSHYLVLNKFAIVEEHFILTTKEFEWQTDLLGKEDLWAALGCVNAYREYDLAKRGEQQTQRDDAGGRQEQQEYGELFVFFNSGEHSGASQPHRHLQLLPVERMRDGLEEHLLHTGSTGKNPKRWDVLANSLLDHAVAGRLPFKTFAERIPRDITAHELHSLYLGLYRRACAAVLRAQEAEQQQSQGEAKVSYNLAMTRDVLVVMPRVAEGAEITSPDGDGGMVGKLALNGTVLAGTALVKSRAEWDTLREHPEIVVDLLGRIGVPPLQSKV